MQVLFTSRRPVNDDVRELALSRVQSVMSRLTWMVPRVSVQFSDANGHRGGVDKRCQIQFTTKRRGTVVVTAIARDWREALDGALARAKQAVLRLWRRQGAARGQGRLAIGHDA